MNQNNIKDISNIANKLIKEIIDNIIDKNKDSYGKKERGLYKIFLKLSNYEEEKGSQIIDTSIFENEYSKLKLGNGGSWCRMDSTFSKNYKYVLRKMNGKLTLSWKAEENEMELINDDFKSFPISKGNSITHIKVYGPKKDINDISRNIRSDIKEYFKKHCCVVCGNRDIEIDHKNGLYNDKRVLNPNTQTINDFQPLCRHCNQQKRQSIILTKQTGKRYKATNIPHLIPYGIDFISGTEDYDKNDINAMVGTYWYDPVQFHKNISGKIESLKNEIEMLKNFKEK